MYLNSITTGTNSCVGIAYPSGGASEFTPSFLFFSFLSFFLGGGVIDAQSLVFSAVFCISLSFNPFTFGHCFACPLICDS